MFFMNRKNAYSRGNSIPNSKKSQYSGNNKWDKDERCLWRKLISCVKRKRPRRIIHIWRKPISKSIMAKVYQDETTKEYYILVNTKCTFDEAFYALMEELAHIDRGITWDEDKNHDSKWGVCYSKWRKYLFDCLLTNSFTTPSNHDP